MPHAKIGFLFLVTDGVAHPNLWERFFQGHRGQYEILTLCKHPERLANGFLKPTLIDEYVRTNHGGEYPHTGLAIGQTALLRAGLRTGCTKFVFVSDTCLPIRRFEFVRGALTEDDRSWITHAPWEERYRMLPEWTPITREQFGTSSNWCALNRRHAEILVRMEPTWMEHFATVLAADEHYGPTVLALGGVDFAAECRPMSPTYVDWSEGPPHRFERLSESDVRKLAESPCLLARKFPPASDVADHLDRIWAAGAEYHRNQGQGSLCR